MAIISNAKNVYGNLKSFFDQFQSAKLVIPAYQREYVWSKSMAEDLWNDIYGAFKNTNGINSHFVGNILLYCPDENGEQYEIIDGQQRITSIILLLYALRECCRSAQDEVSNTIAKKNIDAVIERINRIVGRFETNSLNKDFFISYITNRTKTQSEIIAEYEQSGRFKINVDLMKAYDIYCDKVSMSLTSMLPDSTDMEKFRHLKDLYDFIVEKIEVVILICKEEKMAFSIFETLNNRGKSLDATDLIKNKIVQGMEGKDTIKKWNQMRADFGDNGKFQRYVMYYFSLATGIKQTVRSLYGAINKAFIDGKIEAKTLVDNLYQTYRQFLYFDTEIHSTTVFSNECLVHLAEEYYASKYIFPYYVMIPSFIRYSKGKINDDELYKILSLCYNVMYRFKSVMGRKASEVETEMFSIGCQMMADDKISVGDILEKLSNWIYSNISDDEFKEKLESFTDKSADLAVSYALLRRIESYPESRSATFVWTCYDREIAQLEHVLPKKNKSWTDFSDPGRWVNRLGNHCLLEAKINVQIQTRLYNEKVNGFTTKKGDKVLGYSDSNISPNNTVACAKYIADNYPKWDENAINERQKLLAEKALQLFPVDPAKLFNV